MQGQGPKIWHMVSLLALTLFGAIGLSEIYNQSRDVFGSSRWMAAALVHSALAVLILGFYVRKGCGPFVYGIGAAGSEAHRVFARSPWRAYWPAAGVLGLTVGAVVVSRAFGGAPVWDGSGTHWAWVLWVPLVEEVVFRGGVGPAMRKIGGPLWGSWFSAICFSLVHSNPTWQGLAQGTVGLPLGPLFLGFATEALVVTTGRLLPAVALHAVCNSTVAIFAFGDKRWLDWLGFLYM